jgi:hypothetical protein
LTSPLAGLQYKPENKKLSGEKMTAFQDAQNVQLDIPLPSTVLEVDYAFDRSAIQDVYQAARAEMDASGILKRVAPRSRVAVAVGSRGLANLPVLVKAVVDSFRQRGAEPFITPSMGSHGGGTAEGQIEMLASLGVTEAYLGVKVAATMDVKEIARIPGGPAFYQDMLSASADCTFLIGRVKPHTDFHGPLESGLTKMAVIGLGKKTGATELHEWGASGFQRFLLPAARLYETHTNLIGGLGVVENAYDETAVLQVLTAAEIGGEKEMQLLNTARQKMGSLAFHDIDVLVVRELGKNISGTGMDTNIIGRLMIPREKEPGISANIATIAILDLTEETHGNASGVGLANVTTQRLFDKVDWFATYTNSLTSGIFGMQRVSLPIVMPNDHKAIQAAVRGCGKKPAEARIAFIENTLQLGTLWISPTLAPDARQNSRITIQRELPLRFTDSGALRSPWSIS